MLHSYFSSEEDVRFAIIKSLASRDIKVWDCRSEIGKSPEPIWIAKIELGILIGDFPFLWDGRFYVVEVKFNSLSCKYIKKRNDYEAGRETLPLNYNQIDLMLGGGGILIIVSEPPPTSFKLPKPKSSKKNNCEEKLFNIIKMPLSKNQIPYEVWILGKLSFAKYWKKFLRDSPTFFKKHEGKKSPYKHLSIQKMSKIIPEALTHLSMDEILRGDLTNIILELLQQEKEIKTELKLRNMNRKLRIICETCKKNFNTDLVVYRKMLIKEQIECESCHSANIKINNPFNYQMVKPFFNTEDDVRYTVLESLFKRNLVVWDCSSEVGKCLDPIQINNIPMKILVGDIPFLLKNKYYIMELKFNKQESIFNSNKNLFKCVRSQPKINDAEIKLMLEGGGCF